jgi:hypothetical protein
MECDCGHYYGPPHENLTPRDCGGDDDRSLTVGLLETSFVHLPSSPVTPEKENCPLGSSSFGALPSQGFLECCHHLRELEATACGTADKDFPDWGLCLECVHR